MEQQGRIWKQEVSKTPSHTYAVLAISSSAISALSQNSHRGLSLRWREMKRSSRSTMAKSEAGMTSKTYSWCRPSVLQMKTSMKSPSFNNKSREKTDVHLKVWSKLNRERTILDLSSSYRCLLRLSCRKLFLCQRSPLSSALQWSWHMLESVTQCSSYCNSSAMRPELTMLRIKMLHWRVSSSERPFSFQAIAHR